MRLPFDGNFRISQYFGENPDMYKKFGLLGHNGIDWACPTGTKILAPHAGKIIESAYDANGYGNYVKIENDKEGSVLGHFQALGSKVGVVAVEGQQVGISDNTGYSTGPHLHWGYYSKPRDRTNGYNGYINQLPLIYGRTMSENNELQECLRMHTQLVNEANAKDATISAQSVKLTELFTRIKELEEESHNYQAEFEKADALRDKWYQQVVQYKAYLEVCKTERATLAGKVTKLENYSYPQHKFLKKLYEILMEIDRIANKGK